MTERQDCMIKGCDEPRHVSSTGQSWAWLCDDHERMFKALTYRLLRRWRSSVGATYLFRRLATEPDDAMLAVLQAWLRSRFGSAEGADDIIDGMLTARDRDWTPPTV